MEVKNWLLRLLVIVGLAFLTESSEIEVSGDDNNHLTCDAMREIFQREMARHEEQIVELKEQNDKLKEEIARYQKNRNDEVQQDKQLQDLRRENKVVRLADSEINQSIMRQRDSSGLTAEYCRKNADKMAESVATNKKKLTECGPLVELLRTRLVDGPDEKSGRLEVFVDGEWGSVCSYGTTGNPRGSRLAKVVCKSLGFSGGNYHPFGKKFGNAAAGVPIFMDYVVKCTGNERSIHDCPWWAGSPGYQRMCKRDMLKHQGKHINYLGWGLDLGISCD